MYAVCIIIDRLPEQQPIWQKHIDTDFYYPISRRNGEKGEQNYQYIFEEFNNVLFFVGEKKSQIFKIYFKEFMH